MGAEQIKLILVCFGVGAGLVVVAWRQRRRALLIEETPRSKVASAPQGLVEIEGFAWPKDNRVFKTALGQDVLYYEFHLQKLETQGSGKNKKKSWVNVFSLIHKEDFYICDPTGLAVVDPTACELKLKKERITLWKALSAEQKTQTQRAVVSEDIKGFPPGEGFFGSLFGETFRIKENEIAIGSPVYVTGEFSSFEEAGVYAKELGLTAFSKMTMDREGRAIKDRSSTLDTNNDGHVSSDEARTGYANAARVARSRVEAEEPFEIFGTIKQTDNHKLFIADDHEARLVANLLRFNLLKMAGGISLVILGFMLCFGMGSNWSRTVAKALPSKKRQTRILRSVASPVALPATRGLNELHEACVSKNDAPACDRLVKSSQQFHLSADYLKYYRDSAVRIRSHVP